MKKSRLLSAVCAGVFSFISLPSYAVAFSEKGTWKTTLQVRDFDANPASID